MYAIKTLKGRAEDPATDDPDPILSKIYGSNFEQGKRDLDQISNKKNRLDPTLTKIKQIWNLSSRKKIDLDPISNKKQHRIRPSPKNRSKSNFRKKHIWIRPTKQMFFEITLLYETLARGKKGTVTF